MLFQLHVLIHVGNIIKQMFTNILPTQCNLNGIQEGLNTLNTSIITNANYFNT